MRGRGHIGEPQEGGWRMVGHGLASRHPSTIAEFIPDETGDLAGVRQSFSKGGLATRFYEDFRNGLVHEARIKNGGQFSLEIGSTVEQLRGVLLINPARLGVEVRSAINGYAALLERDAAARQRLARALARDHARDFAVP